MNHFSNYIDGQWDAGTSSIENKNPSDLSDVIGTYAQGTSDDVSRASAAAKKAFSTWSTSTPQARHDLLEYVGSALFARKEEFGEMLSREEGKTLAEGIGETIRASQVFKFFAGEALRVTGDLLSSVRPAVDVEVTREALGIIGVITPWNFPIAIPAWKIAPALAFGNCVVFKPASETLACAQIITKLLEEAGCPTGVFNLVMGSGREVGAAILEDRNIAAVSFTGSVATGRHVAAKCTETHKKFQLEMGGKNPMLILDDADVDHAVATCINGAFFSTGQRCTASSRLIVQAGIHDEFVEKMKAELGKLTVGDARENSTHIGPVINESQLRPNLKYVALAKEEGAEVIGGERLTLEKDGYYQAPALFLNTTNDMRINQEEIFGPCASIIKVASFEEGMDVCNDTSFGLSAGICTKSLKAAHDFKKQIQAGMVMVNLPTAGVDYHTPFGGIKGSSYGAREQGQYAVEFYTSVKTAYVHCM